MTVLVFKNFIGRLPILEKTKLPANAGQVCKNAVVESNVLAPMKSLGPALLSPGVPTLRVTVYYIPTYNWMSWTNIVDVVPAPVVNTDYRFFYAGPSEGYPKVCSKTLAMVDETRRLGVLQPNYADSGNPLNFWAVGEGDGTVKHTVSYAYTCVDEFGGESVLSIATAPYDLEGNQCMKLTGFFRNSLALYGNDIRYFRLYRRVQTSSGNGDWFWVKACVESAGGTAYWDLPIGSVNETTEVFDSNSGGTDLGEIGDNCESDDYDPPPESVIGLTEIQNGVMLAWTANQVCPNVPFVYHAFPAAYRIDFAEIVMGIGVFNETALVATSGQPYLIGGVSPANYIKKKLPYPWPCLARRSVVSSNIGVFYASERGMVWWDGTNISIVTKKLISEAQWTALNPANMIAFFYKGQVYVFSYGSANGFILDVSGDQPFIIDFTMPYPVYGGFVDAGTDDLKLICYGGGAYNVFVFGNGSNLKLEWQSREEITPAMNFSAMKILGSGWGSATVELYADGVLQDTVSASANMVSRLKAGYRAERWHVVINSSSAEIEAVAIGTSVGEIKNV